MALNSDFLLELVPSDLTQPIGVIITQWAWSEAMLDSLIWRLMQCSHRRGRIITSHLLAGAKIDMLSALLRLRRKDESVIQHLELQGKHLAAQRNLVAHGYLAAFPLLLTNAPKNPPPYAHVISYTARGKLADRTRAVTPNELMKLASAIAAFNLFLMYSVLKPPPSRDKQPRQVSLTPRNQRRRLKTMMLRLPPLLEAEPPKGQTAAQQQAVRLAKKASKERDRQRDLAKKK